jgi:hypothetical protein
MPRKRKRHSAEFKAKGALEGVKGVKTAQQLGKGFQVHSTRITIGKKQLLGQVVVVQSKWTGRKETRVNNGGP